MFTNAATSAVTDLSRVERRIGKEPRYRGQPKYGLLVFGPEARDRVWLVHDGDTLYVDRNGDGDLTDEGEKIAATIDKNFDPKEYGYSFEVGDVHVGGRVHKHLRVYLPPLARYANSNYAGHAAFRKALVADPKALATNIGLEVASSRLKGDGVEGRLRMSAGLFDANGVLRLADRPGDAPIIHFDGPLQVTVYGSAPTFQLARRSDAVLVVGTPGRGPGTFAMLSYRETILDSAYVRADICWPSSTAGAQAVQRHYDLRDRC